MVRLPGDPLPQAAQVEMAVAAWSMGPLENRPGYTPRSFTSFQWPAVATGLLIGALDNGAALAGSALLIL